MFALEHVSKNLIYFHAFIIYFVEMRQRGRFAGFSIYISNNGGINDGDLCYKNGPVLPFLSISVECFGFGRYVIYYNERFPGEDYPEGFEQSNVHTELCEVSVQGKSTIL